MTPSIVHWAEIVCYYAAAIAQYSPAVNVILARNLQLSLKLVCIMFGPHKTNINEINRSWLLSYKN